MKHYLLLPILLLSNYTVTMEDDDKLTTLVVAAWGTTKKKQLSSEWAEFLVKKNQHGDCSVKYKNLPMGIIMPLYCGPSEIGTVPWPKDKVQLVSLVVSDEQIKLTIQKNSWYKHPALTHSIIALSAILVTYAAAC